ncbi:hypothetical protein WSK_3217 [Novosphingobium sp. Rr 2-17]|nr:hypothetical protein WSK_3217 [Novosphingobium sp. Rr 2-17]
MDRFDLAFQECPCALLCAASGTALLVFLAALLTLG